MTAEQERFTMRDNRNNMLFLFLFALVTSASVAQMAGDDAGLWLALGMIAASIFHLYQSEQKP